MTTYKKTKDMLDKISPSMCLAKWQQVGIHLHNGQTHSCHHPNTHTIPEAELKHNPSALHNTNENKISRIMLSPLNLPLPVYYHGNVTRESLFPDDFYRSKKIS